MINYIKEAVLRLFGIKRYRRLEIRMMPYKEADNLLSLNAGKEEGEQWVVATYEEDMNHTVGYVYMERREEI